MLLNSQQKGVFQNSIANQIASILSVYCPLLLSSIQNVVP